jgi:uracil-DNA glycosylase
MNSDKSKKNTQSSFVLFAEILDDVSNYIESLNYTGQTNVEFLTTELNMQNKSEKKSDTNESSNADEQSIEHQLKSIADQVAACAKCPLHKTRHKTVPGEGKIMPDIMFIGEAPGFQEDKTGHPFVGRAGMLLDRLLERIGYSRQQVFIGNIIKCRPPNNRKPEDNEIEACLPFLLQQIKLIQPKVIVALGATALYGLKGSSRGITKERGVFQEFNNIPLMPTFHPSYLLRNKQARWDVWDDMLKILDYLGKKPVSNP